MDTTWSKVGNAPFTAKCENRWFCLNVFHLYHSWAASCFIWRNIEGRWGFRIASHTCWLTCPNSRGPWCVHLTISLLSLTLLPFPLTLCCLLNKLKGLGKSQLLQAVSNVAPRGVYVCGSYSSTSGLTVTLFKDKGTGDYALEAGALILGDQVNENDILKWLKKKACKNRRATAFFTYMYVSADRQLIW